MQTSRMFICRIFVGFCLVILIPYGSLYAEPKGVWSLLKKARSVSTTPDCGKKVNTLISRYREVLTLDPKNEEARDIIAATSWECAVKLESAESREDSTRANILSNLIHNNFIDTLWRTGYKAKHGDGKAQLALGVYNRRGILVSKPSKKKACKFYKQAADQGVAAASYRYSLCLASNNKTMAMKYNQQAAESGHAAAQHLLGEYYLGGSEKMKVRRVVGLKKRLINTGQVRKRYLVGCMQRVLVVKQT